MDRMSKDIFMVDYSNCDDTIREVKSNINYINAILEIINEMNNYASQVGTETWNRGAYDTYVGQLKENLNREIERYNQFNHYFKVFYDKIESIDNGLSNLISSQFEFIKENENYEIYVSMIQMNQNEELQESIYDKLISIGLSEEEAMKLSIITDTEMANLLNELSQLDENELDKKIKDIENKAIKSPEELLLTDILKINEGITHVDFIKSLMGDVSQQKWSSIIDGLLSKGILSGKSISQYNLDINSLNGQISILDRQIRNSQLSQRNIDITIEELERLRNNRNVKVSNMTKVETTKNAIKKGGVVAKWLGRAIIVYQVTDITREQWEDYSKNGVELDDAIIAESIDGLGIVASVVTGTIVTTKVTTVIGTSIAPGVGTVVGFVVGVAAGIGFSFLYELVVDPFLTDVYNNSVEPFLKEARDDLNDIGDWWDTLWW